MILLPVLLNEFEMDLFVFLQDENIERMKQYDPAQIVRTNMLPEHRARNIRSIIIGYATAEEEQWIANHATSRQRHP